MLTIAYTTSRRNPRFEWFAEGLARQLNGDKPEVLVIDFYADERDLGAIGRSAGLNCRSMAPKPTVWQGKHRLTPSNYFAASNARNTAICAAKGDYLVLVDDLSVPGRLWYSRAKAARDGGYVVCGSYEKALAMVVEKGKLISMSYHEPGQDGRRKLSPTFGRGYGSWFYGCSCGAPIQAFLDVNGYPEIADGMGYEDAVTGWALEANGYQLFFDPEMLTIESEEAHHEDPPFLRRDYGTSPNDKSHALLNICRGVKRFDNYFGEEGIAGLRRRIQSGEPFPVPSIPTHEWFTGKPLSELE